MGHEPQTKNHELLRGQIRRLRRLHGLGKKRQARERMEDLQYQFFLIPRHTAVPAMIPSNLIRKSVESGDRLGEACAEASYLLLKGSSNIALGVKTMLHR